MERSNNNSQPITQLQEPGFFNSALDYARKAIDTVIAAGSTEESPPSSPTLSIPGAYYPREPYSSGNFSTVLASEPPSRTIEHLYEANITDDRARGVDQTPYVAAVPGQSRHHYDNSGTPATEISHNPSPDIEVPFEQRSTRSVDRAFEKPEVGVEDTLVELATDGLDTNNEIAKQALQDAIHASVHRCQAKRTIGGGVLCEKLQHLDGGTVNEVDKLSGDRGLAAIPEQTCHVSDNSGTLEAKGRKISHNRSTAIGDPSDQENTHVSTQDATSLFQGAHHLTIGGNSHFENNGFKNEHYYYGNYAEIYDISIIKEFVSFKAMHDSSSQDPTRRVHPGTRQCVLKRIQGWIDNPSATEPIFWLHGPAGIGKSAIAQTIAHLCTREKLAGTFFFCRSDPSCNDGNRLFPTLAWQFAFSVPATKNALIRSLTERPDIPEKNIEMQFEELIVKPFLASKRCGVQLSTPVVIIDGVDECSDDDIQRRFLKIIGNAVKNDHVPLRFLICSRPEAHIQDTINLFQSFTLALNLAELDDANKDIEEYLKTEFSRIETEQGLDPAWPGEQIIQEFVSKTCGQFIYATTVIKYVGDEYSSAETQLDIIRGLKPPSSISPFAELDGLYKEILRRQRDPVFLKDFLSLLIGYNGIKLNGLHEDDAMLMNVSERELHRKLRGMRSLLKFNPYIDVHHSSFLEFLHDPSRSGQYHISKQAGTRRYLEMIADSLIRYTLIGIERHDDHKSHFMPFFYRLSIMYSTEIVLPVKEWQGALQPLLDLWNKLLALPNFRGIWELLPCKKCIGFHAMRDLLLHLTFRLETSDPRHNPGLTKEPYAEEMHSTVIPSIPTETDTNVLEKDLIACLSALLPRIRRRKTAISVDMDMIQLTCSLLRFDHIEIAMRLQSISDAQNLVDLVDELINNKSFCNDYGSEVSCKAVRLVLEIYTRVPVLPRSLFSKGSADPHHHVWTISRQTELSFQTAFMGKFLDPNYTVRVSWIYEDNNKLSFMCDKVNDNNESLTQWRKRSRPSSVTRIRVMLEVAKAIRYFHSIDIVLHPHVGSDDIFLDSRFHAKFRFFGLTAQYVKVTPIVAPPPKLHSREANIFFFGCLFYETCFDAEISYSDRINNNRNVEKRPSKPEIHDDAWQLIQRCCAEDPKSQPTMDDIVRDMEALDIT